MPKHDSGTTTPKQSSKKNPSTDAIQMLKEDHRKVEALFDRFLEGEEGRKSQIAEQIFHELETHSTLEEELFYPALQDPGGTGESASVDRGEEFKVMNMIINAYDEHRVVRDIIAQLRQKDALSREFQQAMIELQQTVADHVLEEEDELFAEAQLTVDTKMLGMQMRQRKKEIVSAAA